MKRSIPEIVSMVGQRLGVNLGSVQETVELEQRRPLTAAIFGQTGCGKSSLTNAIFGTRFEVDDVRPCTKMPQSYESRDRKGNPITFWDLPGIGESEAADKKYIDMYLKYASSCDVVLWAFQADTRATTLDATAFDALAKRMTPEDRARFLGKVSVVVTKADVIAAGPWIFSKSGDATIIAASKETEETLDRKAVYFYDCLFGDFKRETEYRVATSAKPRTVRDLPPDFRMDETERFLCHRGEFNDEMLRYLLGQFPTLEDELRGLAGQSRAVCCSARYRFNLNEVKAGIAMRGKGRSMLRISQSMDDIDTVVPWRALRGFGLPVFFDQSKGKTIFNIEDYEG